MECYHCGRENSDDAVFCKHCGQKINDRRQCPSCKNLIDCDSQYCEKCGAVIPFTLSEQNGKSAYKSSPSAKYGSFEPNKSHIKKINGIIMGISSMLSVFVSLLFTFFIGVKMSGKTVDDTNGIFHSPIKIDLFYYLGKSYESLALLGESYPEIDISSFYFITAIYTVLSVAVIALVVTFSIIALIRFINFTTKKSTKDYFPLVLATNFTFILGSMLFFAMNAMSIQSDTNSLHTELNEYTIAAIALSSTFIFISAICKTLSLGRLLAEPLNVNKTCFSVLGIAALTSIAALSATPSISLTIDNACVSFGFLKALLLISAMELTDNEGALNLSEMNLEILYANIIVNFLIQVTVIIMAILMIATLLARLSNNEKLNNYKALGVSIALGVLSVASLILTKNLDVAGIFKTGAEDVSSAYSYKITSLIILVVISAVNIAVQILHSIMNFKAVSQS